MDSSMELHNIQNPNMGIYNTTADNEPNSWAPTNVNVEMGNFSHYINNNDSETPTTFKSDLLTLLHLPRCSLSSSSTLLPPNPFGFLNPVGISDNPSGPGSNTISYDPTTTMPFDPYFHLNLRPQPSPLSRDLMFQKLPMGYRGENGDGMNTGSNSLFGRLEEGEVVDIINGINGLYLDGDAPHHHINPNGIFEVTSGNVNACVGEDKEGQCPKNFVTERQRWQNFNGNYIRLRGLVPNPTKPDRISIVKDAIDYIQELKRTVRMLKVLVETKRIFNERSKRHKTEENTTPTSTPTPGGTSIVDIDKEKDVNGVTDGSGQVKPDLDEGFNSNQLRSSWLLRKWKDGEVDIRIVDDDVTIKLVQRKKINCLMAVARTLDELQLDLCHVTGGRVGDYYSYLFNTKVFVAVPLEDDSSVKVSAFKTCNLSFVTKSWAPVHTLDLNSKNARLKNRSVLCMSVQQASTPTRKVAVSPPELDDAKEPPLHLYKAKDSYSATIVSVERLVGPKAPGETCHIVINHGGNVPYWEGQSYGVIPPGENPKKPGSPHNVRLYSIASTRYGDSFDGMTASLCVRRAVYYNPETGIEDPGKNGICSNFLCDAKPGDKVQIAGPSGKVMLLPEEDPNATHIMIATGTGVAPYRGYLRRMFMENVSTFKFNGLAWLFLGVANTDSLLYNDEFTTYLQDYPKNFRYDTALSREEKNKKGGKMYVQDKIEEYSNEIFKLLDIGAHIYFCGLKGMMPGIQDTLKRVAEERGEKWEEKLAKLKKNKQWHVEVY